MSWARLDDLYDDHPKLLAAVHVSPLAAALHAHAISATARRETDGVVDPFWLLARAPDERERSQALNVLRDLGLFDVVPAGETRDVTDAQGFTVTLGPWAEDRYVVHDYLEYNPSSAQLADRRARDAQRKKDSARNPGGTRAESKRSPTRARARGSARPLPHPIPSPSPPLETASRAGATRARDAGRQNSSTEWDGNRPLTEREHALCTQFSEHPPWRVLHAVHALSKPGERVSDDALRAYLNDSA